MPWEHFKNKKKKKKNSITYTTSLKLNAFFICPSPEAVLADANGKIIFAYTISAYIKPYDDDAQLQNSLYLHWLIDKCNKWIVSNWALPSVPDI